MKRASLRLRGAQCQRLFSEFADESGQPLQARLDRLGLTAEHYLAFVIFQDGSRHRTCAADGTVPAFTSPGSRVVHVCAGAFFHAFGYDAVGAEAIVIHEALHTLGLGENPPSALEITRRVLQRCR